MKWCTCTRKTNFSLKEENTRYKWEKKRLHSLLTMQAIEKKSLNGNSPSNKIAIVEKITKLERENIELMKRNQEILKLLQVERQNYAKFLRFIFLKILVFKRFTLSQNQIVNNDSRKFKNINTKRNLLIGHNDCFFVNLCNNQLEEDSISSENRLNSVIDHFLSNHENKCFLSTRDVSVLCKLGAINNENQVKFKANDTDPFQNKFYNRNRKVNPHLKAVSSGDCNPSSNLQRVILLIQLYKEKFHNEFEDKINSKVKTQPSSEFRKVNKNLKTSFCPIESKLRLNQFNYLKRKNPVSSSISHIIRIRGNNKIIPTKNDIYQKKSISKIENSVLGLDSKLEVVIKPLLSLEYEKSMLGKRENQEYYLELFSSGKDIFWNNVVLRIRLNEIFSIKFHDSFIMNNLENKCRKFDMEPNLVRIEVQDRKKNYLDSRENILKIENCDGKTIFEEVESCDQGELLDSHESALYSEVEAKNYKILEYNRKNGELISKIERERNEIEQTKMKEKDPNIQEFDYKIKELNSSMESELQIGGHTKLEENLKIQEDIKTVENLKIKSFIISKTCMNRSLSAYPMPFSPSVQNLEKPRLIRNRNSVPKIEKVTFKVEEAYIKVVEKDLKTKKERFKVAGIGPKTEGQNTKISKDVISKTPKEFNTILVRKRIGRSLSADRTQFSSTFHRIKKASEKEEKVLKVVEINPKSVEYETEIEKGNYTLKKQDIIIEKLRMKVEELNSKIKAQYAKIEETNSKLQEKDYRIEKSDLKIQKQVVSIHEPDIKIQGEDVKIQETNCKIHKPEIQFQEPDLKIQVQDAKIAEENYKVQAEHIKMEETDSKSQGQDIQIKRLHSKFEESDSNNQEVFKIQEKHRIIIDPNLNIAKRIPVIENLVFNIPDDPIHNMKLKKEIEEKLQTILKRKRKSRLSSADQTHYSRFQDVEKINLEYKKDDSRNKNILSKKSEQYVKVIKTGKEFKRELEVLLRVKKVFDSKASLISSKAFKEGDLIQISEIINKNKSQKNLATQKKISKTKTIQSSQKVIKKKKLKYSKRTQTSEIKLEKPKVSRKVQISSKSSNKKVSKSLHKKTLSTNSVDFPTIEFKTRPKSAGKSKPKVETIVKVNKTESQEQIKTKRKIKHRTKNIPKLVLTEVGELSVLSEIQVTKLSRNFLNESTETNPRVDFCVFKEKSDINEDMNKTKTIISKRDFLFEGVKDSSNSISMQSIGNDGSYRLSSKKFLFPSKTPDTTSLFLTNPISRLRQSNEGKEENQLENKYRSTNKRSSKESGRTANKVSNCNGGSNIESSWKGYSDKQNPNNSPANCEIVNMSDKHKISLRSDAIEGSEYPVTSLTRNYPGAPVIMIGGDPMTNQIIQKEKNQPGRTWSDEISKIEAWNVRVRDYLKQVRVKLLEEEKALEKERQGLRQGNYSPGDGEELTSRKTVESRYPKTPNNLDSAIKIDLQGISRDVERVKNIINNHIAVRYLNRRDFHRVNEKLKDEAGSVTKLSCRSSGNVTAILSDIGEYWNTFDLQMHVPKATAKIIRMSKETIQ
ncbi:uncharacterized protein LOC117171806 isoform X2 [Belonocnema kinseyi]|uniref:uncharacterized protein LOC117171806 isoform X2 n=1 Tax=Belonocnema kinseyi TaxID=2817044 RepID=UPI00143DED03|nr:uncharacterized protein LOC117171806 isoform X2 [Belonocnema kinseyi]